jgi:23S rRNA G2445 N2-methylase RlmL
MLFVCPEGAEPQLAEELRAFGASELQLGRAWVRCLDPPGPEEAGIGGLTVALRACLGSAVTSRVLWPVGRFAAVDAASLYAGARRLPWHDWLAPQKTVAVRARRTEGQLSHGPYVAQVVKDALCDAMREQLGARPDVDRKEPDLLVQVAIRRGEAEIWLDLSGPGLASRGRTPDRGAAPLKEHLAAAILRKAAGRRAPPAASRWSIPCAAAAPFCSRPA